MLPPHSSPSTINAFLHRFETTLLHTWQETGFGHLAIDSKRVNQSTQIMLQGAVHHHYSIRDQEIMQVLAQRSTCYPYAISDQLITQFEALLLEIWHQTHFGHLVIDSKRISQNKIQVILRGSTHYRFLITDDAVKEWIANVA